MNYTQLVATRWSIIVFTLCLPIITSAQLRIDAVNGPKSVDGSKYPNLSFRVRVTNNNQPFQLTKDNSLIIEDNYVTSAESVSEVGGNEYIIRWKTRNRQQAGVSGRIVAFQGNSTGTVTFSGAVGLGPLDRVPQIRYNNIDGRINFMNIGKVTPGTTFRGGVRVIALSGKADTVNGTDQPVRIDSITNRSPYYKVNWIGGPENNAIPGYIYPSLGYIIEILFTPPDTNFYRDVIAIHFEGGLVEYLNVSGNEFNMKTATVLNMVYPNGGEKITPCQNVNLRWTGAVSNAVTLVQYSPDGGKNWETVTRTTDTTFAWTVPDIETDNLIFRVSQYVESQDENPLLEPNSGICDKVFFAPDNKRLAAVYRDGRVIEWNIESKQKIQTYQLRANGRGLAQAIGCGFTSETTFFVAYKSLVTNATADTIAFFTTTSTTPIAEVSLGRETRYKAAMMDSTRSSIIMLPVLGSQIDLRNSATGEVQRTVQFPSIVNALSLGVDIAVATLLNGRITIYSLPTWAEQSSVSLPEIPIMEQVMLLPDRKRIAIGCRENAPSIAEGMSAPALIYDIPTQQIVRTNLKSKTTALGVAANATSKVVIFAYKGQPQTPFWDMATNTVSGELTSHAGELTSVAFSDDGRNVASTATSTDNLRVKKFIFPEADLSDAPTRVVKPKMASVDAIMPRTYAFSSSDSLYTANLCNNGEVPISLGGSWFENKIHFELVGALQTDTIQPGGCATIRFRFSPRDTGSLSDIFNTFMCNSGFKLNVQGYAIPRSLNTPDTIDFGDLCIGGSIEQELTIVRNSDPVPITINSVQLDNSIGTWFSMLQSPKDAVLAASNGTAKITVRFNPRDTGIQYRELRVYYGDQRKVFSRIILRGRGAGTTLQATGSPFVFIPEERTRTLVFRNTNNNAVTVSSFNLQPSGGFSISPVSVPLTLGPGDSIVTTVRWLSTDSSSARIETTLEPCSTAWNLNITRYTARSTVAIDALQADPNADSAMIPITFSTNENAPYNGERTFSTEFSVNPRMFLPLSVSSTYGVAKITRNDIVGDRRIVGVEVRGNFPEKGVAAVIRGIAGLAERDTSNLTFNPTSLLWGTAVQTTLRNGSLKLVNLCDDRRVIQHAKTVSILAVQPNPANDGSDVSIRSESELSSVSLYSPTGEKLIDGIPTSVAGNLATYRIDTRQLASGTYTIVARSPMAASSTLLVVVK